MAGQEAVEAGSGPRKRVRAPTRAGYRQVMELMGHGYGAQEIRKILHIPPNRLRQILASRNYLKMMQLEGQFARGTAVLRVGGNVNEAINMLKAVWDCSDPECVRKAAMGVLDIATQPPPGLSDYRRSAEDWKLARLLRQLASDAGILPASPAAVSAAESHERRGMSEGSPGAPGSRLAGETPAPLSRGGRNIWDTRRENDNA